jgi:hypothetical protein
VVHGRGGNLGIDGHARQRELVGAGLEAGDGLGPVEVGRGGGPAVEKGLELAAGHEQVMQEGYGGRRGPERRAPTTCE